MPGAKECHILGSFHEGRSAQGCPPLLEIPFLTLAGAAADLLRATPARPGGPAEFGPWAAVFRHIRSMPKPGPSLEWLAP